MGMYTELVLKCRIKDNVPDNVLAVLDYLFNRGDEPDISEFTHEFFKCPRGDVIGRGSSYYHHPTAMSEFTEGYIFSRSDLKNYDGEIRKFLNWLSPYIEDYGNCIGWEWYEEAQEPTLLFLKDVS